jgi:hypothetical protein
MSIIRRPRNGSEVALFEEHDCTFSEGVAALESGANLKIKYTVVQVHLYGIYVSQKESFNILKIRNVPNGVFVLVYL